MPPLLERVRVPAGASWEWERVRAPTLTGSDWDELDQTPSSAAVLRTTPGAVQLSAAAPAARRAYAPSGAPGGPGMVAPAPPAAPRRGSGGPARPYLRTSKRAGRGSGDGLEGLGDWLRALGPLRKHQEANLEKAKAAMDAAQPRALEELPEELTAVRERLASARSFVELASAPELAPDPEAYGASGADASIFTWVVPARVDISERLREEEDREEKWRRGVGCRSSALLASRAPDPVGQDDVFVGSDLFSAKDWHLFCRLRGHVDMEAASTKDLSLYLR